MRTAIHLLLTYLLTVAGCRCAGYLCVCVSVEERLDVSLVLLDDAHLRREVERLGGRRRRAQLRAHRLRLVPPVGRPSQHVAVPRQTVADRRRLLQVAAHVGRDRSQVGGTQDRRRVDRGDRRRRRRRAGAGTRRQCCRRPGLPRDVRRRVCGVRLRSPGRRRRRRRSSGRGSGGGVQPGRGGEALLEGGRG